MRVLRCVLVVAALGTLVAAAPVVAGAVERVPDPDGVEVERPLLARMTATQVEQLARNYEELGAQHGGRVDQVLVVV